MKFRTRFMIRAKGQSLQGNFSSEAEAFAHAKTLAQGSKLEVSVVRQEGDNNRLVRKVFPVAA
jgi:hypothetical protein